MMNKESIDKCIGYAKIINKASSELIDHVNMLLDIKNLPDCYGELLIDMLDTKISVISIALDQIKKEKKESK